MNIYSMHSLYVFVKIQKVSDKNDNGLLKSDFCDEEPYTCMFLYKRLPKCTIPLHNLVFSRFRTDRGGTIMPLK